MNKWTKKELVSLNSKWIATRNRGTLDGSPIIATFQDSRSPIKVMVLENGRIRRAGAGRDLLPDTHYATRFIDGLATMKTNEIIEAYNQMTPKQRERTVPNPKDC